MVKFGNCNANELTMNANPTSFFPDRTPATAPASTQADSRSSSHLPPPGSPRQASSNLPDSGLTATARRTAQHNRLFFVTILLVVVLVIQSVALTTLIPLKQPTAIFVERNESNGAIKTVATTSQTYVPTQGDLKYFLTRWVTWTYSVHRLTTERDLEEARNNFTRGTAVNQFDDFVRTDQPITRLRVDPGYSRRVEISSVSIFKEGAVIKFNAIEQGTQQREARSIAMVATLQFTLVPPTSEQDILRNPAGLFITDMNFTRDLAS